MGGGSKQILSSLEAVGDRAWNHSLPQQKAQTTSLSSGSQEGDG